MELPATLGKYELLEFLGGGMSHVYRARDTVIDRAVVVKILTDSSCQDAEAKARFLQEARLAGGFQHENIVSVFDYGEFDGKPFIVMEYLKGEDLREAIRNSRLGGMNDRLRIALHIADALDYVHGRAIVHRDIKPENIHIDPNGKVKLMDFGIAKTADLSLTRTGMAMGTPYYMSPEQISGSATSHLVDIYAYGLLLFELLTGIRSVRGETMEQVFFQILNQTVDVAAMENAGVPPAVRDLVVRCTAKKPEDRPQSFRAISEELRGILAGESRSATRTVPRAAAPPAPVQAEPASSKKSKAPLFIGAAAVVVIAAGIAFWLLRPASVPVVPGMVYMPAGTFLAGQDKKPQTLKAFFIDETEVSNGDLLQSHGMQCRSGAGESSQGRHHLAEARAYAGQIGKRLPTSLEWERALRGTQGALFPWGDQKDPSKANVSDNPAASHQLMPVRSFAGPPDTLTYNMIGNAWEMVEGSVTPSATAIAMFATVMTPPATAQEPWVTMRGGSFDRALDAGFAYDSVSIPERFSARNVGFRCAKDP